MFLTVSKLYHNNASSDNIFITFYSSAFPVSPNILILIAMYNNYRYKQFRQRPTIVCFLVWLILKQWCLYSIVVCLMISVSLSRTSRWRTRPINRDSWHLTTHHRALSLFGAPFIVIKLYNLATHNGKMCCLLNHVLWQS